jgi:hypothetical protein
MTKRLAFLAPLVALAGCASFYSAPVVPPGGWIYSKISAPIDVDANTTAPGSKKGTAHTESILGLVAWGDCSGATAAANGGLSKINHLDYEFFNILGIYSKFTTRAHGE